MRAALLLLLALLPGAAAIGVQDGGDATLEGHATDLVERRVVLDLWDAGQRPRAFALRVLPDSDVAEGVEARARAVNGPEGAWRPAADLRIAAGPDRKAADRGWDGLYEVAFRLRLPNAERARLALALVEEAPGTDGLALTTTLLARPLDVRAWAEAGGLVAEVAGGKAPSSVEASAGGATWDLARDADGRWRAPWPAGVAELRVRARFADGGALEGPAVARPDPQPAAPADARRAGDAPAPAAVAPGAPLAPPSPGPEEPLPPRPAPRRGPAAPAATLGVPVPPISVAVAAVAAAALGAAHRFK